MCGNLKFWEARQDIKLGDVQGMESIKLVSVLDDVKVEPSALTLTASGGSKLVTNILNFIADFVIEPGWEWTSADTGCVGLHDTNGGLN